MRQLSFLGVLFALLALASQKPAAARPAQTQVVIDCQFATIDGQSVSRSGHDGTGLDLGYLFTRPGAPEVGVQGGYQNTEAFPGARLTSTFEELRLGLPLFASPGASGTCPTAGLFPFVSAGITQQHLWAPSVHDMDLRSPSTTIADRSGPTGSLGLVYRFSGGVYLSAGYRFLPDALDVPASSFALALGYGFPVVAGTPFPATTSRPLGIVYTPPPTPPPPSATPTVIIRETPAPSPTSTQTPCSTWQTDGYMQAVQGVWQDDPTFADKPGKQITLVKKPAVYEAEMPMIDGRDTALYGLDHYEFEGKPHLAPGHPAIIIDGQTTCTIPVAVNMHFHLRDGGIIEDLGTTGGGTIPLKGSPLPNGAVVPWRVAVATYPNANGTFKLLSTPYHVWAEIEGPDGPTGFRVDVLGEAVHTEFPPVVVQPVLLTHDTTVKQGLAREVLLQDIGARKTAEALTASAADYIPVVPGSITAVAHATLDYSSNLSGYTYAGKQDDLIAKLTSRLSALGVLSKTGRVVAVLRNDDFKQLDPLSFLESVREGQTAGIALNQKVVIMREFYAWTIPFHELLHTLPFLWSTDEMESLCDRDYHNGADTGVGNGVRLYAKGKLVPREIVASKTTILGRAGDGFYTDQCTYSHLTFQLRLDNDPATLFVRATARRDGSGSFDPLYTVDGNLDAPAGTGTWALVLRDAAGRILQRAPFTPNWDVKTLRAHRNVESVFFRFAMRSNVASVELRNPRGLAAREILSETPPVVTIAAVRQPAPGARSVRIRWRAVLAGGRTAHATVLYSTDGKRYDIQSFEEPISALRVRLDPAATIHRIKVIVTDGSRSGEREVRLKNAP